MLTRKTVKYTDLNGTEREEEFLFMLTKSELTEMKYSVDGGMDSYLDRIVKAKDSTAMMENLTKIILKAYGIKSDDGRRFIKSPEIAEDFHQSVAYDIIFMELVTDEKKMADFINSIIPEIS